MKKYNKWISNISFPFFCFLGFLWILVGVSPVSFGGSSFSEASTKVLNGSFSYTNLSSSAIQPVSLDCRFQSVATGTMTFSRVRSVHFGAFGPTNLYLPITNVLYTVTYAVATNLHVDLRNSISTWLIKNDVYKITDNSGIVSSNFILVTETEIP